MKRTPEALHQVSRLAAEGLSDAEIGDALGVTARTVLRWRQSAGIASQWTPHRVSHGRIGRYRAGCSCGPCKAANNASERRWREQVQDLSEANATRAYEPWTRGEDEVLRRLGPRRAAFALERTYYGCVLRLDAISKEFITN